MDQIDKNIIRRVSEDIGKSLYPFREMASELGITESELISRIRSHQEKGYIRRFGAVLKHQNAGYKANGMSVWNVPSSKVTQVGNILAESPEISHCYERPVFPDWHYNVYGMIHGHSEEEVLRIAKKISEKIAIDDYKVLFSLREFKKSSMVYYENSKNAIIKSSIFSSS